MDNKSKRWHKKDYYATLGLDPSAGINQIKTAYRTLVKKYHPDRYQSHVQKIWATKKLQEINEAYSILKDPVEKKAYDKTHRESDPIKPYRRSNNSYTNQDSSNATHKGFDYFVMPGCAIVLLASIISTYLKLMGEIASEYWEFSSTLQIISSTISLFLLIAFYFVMYIAFYWVVLSFIWAVVILPFERSWMEVNKQPGNIQHLFKEKAQVLGIFAGFICLSVALYVYADYWLLSVFMLGAFAMLMIIAELAALMIYKIWCWRIISHTKDLMPSTEGIED